MTCLRIFICLTLYFLCGPLNAQKECLERILKESSEIDTIEMSSGTGFLIDNSGYIITNRHVVENSRSITVTFQIGRNRVTRNASLILWNRFTDIALIKADIAGLFNSQIPYGFSKNQLKLGERVYTLGFPNPTYMGESIKITDGIVSATAGFQDDNEIYQISAPIQPGNSGSPLFDQQGNVRGIVVASLSGGQNVNYAIKSNLISDLLFQVGVKPPKTLAGTNFNSKLNEIQSRICLIQTESRKSFFAEFDYNENAFHSKSNSMMHMFSLPCGDKDFEEFIRNKSPYTDWTPPESALFQKILNTPLASALYYSYFTNFSWNGMDANKKYEIYLSIGAYGNIIKEIEEKFSFTSNSIDGGWFSVYLTGFFPVYIYSIVNLYADFDIKKILRAEAYIDLLLQILENLKQTANGGKSLQSYDINNYQIDKSTLLIYKAWLITISKKSNEACNFIKQAKQYNPKIEIWFEYDCR